MDTQPRVVKASGQPFSPLLANALYGKQKIIPEWKDYTVSDSPSGTDAGSPDLNDEWPDEIDTEEYRDPIKEDGSNE